MPENVIIVGVDGSDTARQAARAAAGLASELGSVLHVVSAYERDEAEVVGEGNDRWLMSAAKDAEAVAREVASSVRAVVPTVTSSAALGRPAEVLISEAERLDARLIVVGNKNMQGLRRVLGSVANSVAHHASCDVYIVKTV